MQRNSVDSGKKSIDPRSHQNLSKKYKFTKYYLKIIKAESLKRVAKNQTRLPTRKVVKYFYISSIIPSSLP